MQDQKGYHILSQAVTGDLTDCSPWSKTKKKALVVNIDCHINNFTELSVVGVL